MIANREDEYRFGRPLLVLALGDRAKQAADRMFREVRALCGGKMPFHVAFGTVSASESDACRIALRIVSRPLLRNDAIESADDLDAALKAMANPAFHLASDAPPEHVAQLAAIVLRDAGMLSDRARVRSADSAGLAWSEAPAEIVCLVDDDADGKPPFPRWQWAIQIGEVCRPMHPAFAILTCEWPEASPDFHAHTPALRLRESLLGKIPFGQVYLLGSRDQTGVPVSSEDQIAMIADFLLDRLRPECAAWRDELDRWQRIDTNDDPTEYFGSWARREYEFAPMRVMDELLARELKAAVGMPDDTPETADSETSAETAGSEPGDASPGPLAGLDFDPLVAILDAVLTPHPNSRLGRAAAQRSTGSWPPISAQQLERQVADWEKSMWDKVQDDWSGEPMRLAAARRRLAAAERRVLDLSQGLHVALVRTDRAVKQDDLDRPTRIIGQEYLQAHPLRRWFVLLAILLACVAGVAAYFAPVGQMPWSSVGALVLAAVCGAIAWRLHPVMHEHTSSETLPLPFDLPLIRTAVGALAKLALRISQAVGRVDAFHKQWRQALAPVLDSHASDAVQESRLGLLASLVDRMGKGRLRDGAAAFPRMTAEVLRGDREPEEVFEFLKAAFHKDCEFLREWSIERFLNETHQQPEATDERAWASRLAAAWEVPDALCGEVAISFASNGSRSAKAEVDAVQVLHVYKFCRGVVASSAAVSGDGGRVS